MIEELTPQIIAVSLFLIIVIAPILTLLLSALLLWGYRRAVTRAMGTASAFDASAPAAPAAPASPLPDVNPAELYRVAIGGPRHYVIRYVAAGLGFGATFALAARFAYPIRTDLPGFLVGVWIYAWPIVLALPLVVPGRVRAGSIGVVAYLAAFVPVALWAAWVADIPGFRSGGVDLAARSSMAPAGMIYLWLVANGPPTVLMLICLTRRVRAVAPLLLALVTTAVSGTWFALIALSSREGLYAAVTVAEWLGVHVFWMIVATIVTSLAGFGVIGWALARLITRTYRRRKLSEQSLLLDAMWLLFATWYAMWLVFGGLAWVATAPLALAAFKLVLAAFRRLDTRSPKATRDLTFLRVFSLGRRSDALLDGIARYWRHIGSVQMITGPDVALSTVQPHQFLDFLSGKLGRHFVRDQVSLERSLAERDRMRDPDGRFRINNFFCHADSWQPALPRLVEEGDVVLMDLRSFSATNAGCIHELKHLVRNVPLDRCLLIVDDTTDEPFLQRTLEETWDELSPASPNHQRSPKETSTYHFEPGAGALRGLLQQLCEASAK
jgi:hypothetical protein